MANRLPRARTLKGTPSLAVYEKGDGRPDETPLVLVHDATLRADDWENIHPRLATRYRVIAYDLRGHGRSGRATDYGLAAHAADLERILREVAKAPAIVVAHGLGATAALVVAARAGALVRGVVLEDPLLARFGTGWQAEVDAALAAALAKAGDPAGFKIAVSRLPLGAPGPRGERTVGDIRGFYAAERLLEYYAALDPGCVAALRAQADDAAGRALVAESLDAARVPLLVLAADPRHGSALAEGEAERLATRDGLKVVRFPGISHRIHGTRPEPFLEPLEPFLRAHRAR